MAPHFFLPPEVSSTLFYFLTGLFILVVIFICVVAFSVVLSFIIVSAVHCCYHFFQERRQNDLEAGNISRDLSQDFHRTLGEQPRSHETFTLANNVQVLEMLERILRHLGEGREGSTQHRRALERMMPCAIYGCHKEVKPTSCSTSGHNDECVICLENFEKGDSCLAFPVCNHIYHSTCIGNWLRKNPTCPLCRNSILENE